MIAKSEKHTQGVVKAGRVRVYYPVCLIAAVVLMSVSQSRAEESAKEKAVPSAIERMKEAILKKNIFSPARFVRPAVTTESPESQPSIPPADTGPKELEKPFVVVGITYQADEKWAYLSFIKEQGVRRKVKKDDIIETVTIKEILPTYLLCDYAGKEVRIGQGESSSDAYKRVRGILGGEYSLIGTSDSAAQILIQGESRPRWFYIGNVLGNAQVVEIQPGRVILIDQYGEKRILE
jgi:hypothetical protein